MGTKSAHCRTLWRSRGLNHRPACRIATSSLAGFLAPGFAFSIESLLQKDICLYMFLQISSRSQPPQSVIFFKKRVSRWNAFAKAPPGLVWLGLRVIIIWICFRSSRSSNMGVFLVNVVFARTIRSFATHQNRPGSQH